MPGEAAPLLTPDTSVDPVVVVPPVVVAPAVTPPVNPEAALDDAAAKLLDGKQSERLSDAGKAEQDAALKAEEDRKAAEKLANETPEQKAEREAAEEKAKKDKEGEGAPEAYVDFTVPETVKLDGDALEAFKAQAKTDNLTQAQAQGYVDAAVKLSEKWAADQAVAVDSLKAGWRTATSADKEYGGDKLTESLAVAQKALKQFGSPELNELVVGAGLGDHPEFVRLMYRVGKAVSEAPIVNGGKPAGSSDAASVMYPSLPRNV